MCHSESDDGRGKNKYWNFSTPPIVFKAPPDVIVMPDTDDVYVVPVISFQAYSSSSL